MTRLYKKSEIAFAIYCIVIYVVATSIADLISEAIGISKLVTMILHVGMTILMLRWLEKNELVYEYGLCKPQPRAKQFLYYIPFAVLCSSNLWFGAALNMPWNETVFYIVSMFCVGFLEELIFRGLLFKAMCKSSVSSAVYVSSVTFGIGHIVNLFNGSGADVVPTLCQIVSAVAFGYLFVVIFQRGGSLFPCIAAHSAINCLSAFSNDAVIGVSKTIITSVVLSAVAIGYAVVLTKIIPIPQENCSE